MLLAFKLITEEQLGKCVEIQKTRRPRKLLGEIIVEQGIIVEKALQSILTIQKDVSEARTGKTFTEAEMRERIENAMAAGVIASPYNPLLQGNAITREQLDRAFLISRANGISVEQALITRFRVPKEKIGESLSGFYKSPFVPFAPRTHPPSEILKLFPPEYLKYHAFVPLGQEGTRVSVLMADPKNLTLHDDITRRLGREISVKVGIKEDILAFIDDFTNGRVAPLPAAPVKAVPETAPSEEYALPEPPAPEEELQYGDPGIVKLVNQIIESACDSGASDVHIEPYLDDDVIIRTRVDGVCSEQMRVPRQYWRNIVARIKIMASMDISEHRFPQDGKITFKNFGSRDIELRVATLPTVGGMEDVILRLLTSFRPMSLETLGMETDVLERFQQVIQEPYGIVLCVGPTGAGKTTTLHSALGYLNKPDIKICTAEDPVEITQKGLRQVQVHPKIGFTFERAIRSFLRCDPDIMMIGEMRDLETAGAAIEASLTGHLVFSTLHTNNAPETVTRLLDMGLDPYTFGDSLLAVLAQRLVRRLCRKCCERYVPYEKEWAALRREFGNDGLFDRNGYDREKTFLGPPKGCKECNQTGYHGRLAIQELLIVDEEIRLLMGEKARSTKIRESAVANGLVLLKQDGIRKVITGLTDMAEIRTACMKN